MLWYDLNARRLRAAEHAQRLAADARAVAPANRERRWPRRQQALAARARRWAARPQEL
jgi:hypothetical protein